MFNLFKRSKKKTDANDASSADVEENLEQSTDTPESNEANNSPEPTKSLEQVDSPEPTKSLQPENSPEPEESPEPKESPQTAESTQSASNEAPGETAQDNKQPAGPGSESSEEKPAKRGLFGRLKDRLSKTRSNLTEGISSLVLGKKAIDDELLEEIETQLLIADVGIEATREIIDDLTDRVSRKQLNDSDALFNALHENMTSILNPVSKPLSIDTSKSPYVILMVGINGAGKTTTIGKLAKRFQGEGYSVMLAAGDTFRAAAVEQLQVWGERNDIPVVAQASGSDSASVIYDALESAKARGIDIVLADTAGRLHTQSNLMDELSKVKRVASKLDGSAPHEVMLVVDAGIGQNALNQAEEFNKAVGLTGITITKLDGTAKGGILFAIAKKLGIPIRFIGVGESIDDLRTFEAAEFVNALLARERE